jgi:hypothetical protein
MSRGDKILLRVFLVLGIIAFAIEQAEAFWGFEGINLLG